MYFCSVLAQEKAHVQVSNVITMEFEELCGEFENNIDADEGRCKNSCREIVAFICPLPFVGNEALIRKDETYLFM